MINSVIATSHFYYLTFFSSEQLSSIEQVFQLFPDHVETEQITSNEQIRFYHLQADMPRRLGSEALLLLNQSDRNGSETGYWYDFYLGQIFSNDGLIFFITYPYITLSNYIDKFLVDGKTKRKYLKPEVVDVLKYLEKSPTVEFRESGENIFSVEINKYAAIIKDDSASKINISGRNPLKSYVYNLLKKDELIEIEPLSLKLECKFGAHLLELSFDKYGSMRFWLKRNCSDELSNMILNIYQYFDRLEVLKEYNFISKQTSLEGE